MSLAAIKAAQLAELHQQGKPITLIDVRTEAEFRAEHVAFARNAPLSGLSAQAIIDEHGGSAEPLYFICQMGGRSAKACEKLIAAGHANVVNVEGGTLACRRTQLPMIFDNRTIYLERQARAVAGAATLLSLLLAWLVHPYFLAIAAVIGVGLIFSGITNICGLSMLLARLPWNRATQTPSNGS